MRSMCVTSSVNGPRFDFSATRSSHRQFWGSAARTRPRRVPRTRRASSGALPHSEPRGVSALHPARTLRNQLESPRNRTRPLHRRSLPRCSIADRLGDETPHIRRSRRGTTGNPARGNISIARCGDVTGTGGIRSVSQTVLWEASAVPLGTRKHGR